MSRIEKIAFINSFWNIFSVKGKMEYLSETQLNSIIENIIKRVKTHNKINAVMHINRMPIYLN